LKKLQLSPDLSLPMEAVTEKLGFLGRTGTGKSYAAMKLAEQFYAAGAQFVVLDPVGIWFGLRLAANGKDPGIPIPVLGGLKGDVPLEPTAGKIIADLVVDKGTSVIVDVSQFESDTDKARFAMDFASRFFFRKKASPSAVHLFIEEAQEFVPQNPQREEARMLHAFHRLIKLGRNFGIGASLISQRPQEVNKKALNQTELLFAFQMTGPQERKAVEGWIQEKGIDESIAGELPKLKRGHPHTWSPAWLEISRVVSIDKRWTFDSSSTPKVGAGERVRELAPIDIEQLGAEIKKSAERAKAEDPKELRRQVAEKDRQIRQLQSAKPGERVVTKPVVDQAAIDRAVSAAVMADRKRIIRDLRVTHRKLWEYHAPLTGISQAIGGIAEVITTIEQLEAPKSTPVIRSDGDPLTQIVMPHRVPPARRPDIASRERNPVAQNGDLSGLHLRIVNALAELDALGVDVPTREQMAFYVGVSASGGYTGRVIGELKTSGYVDYPVPGLLALTDTGRGAAASVDPPFTLEEFHRRVRQHLSGLHEQIFEVLIAKYPEQLTRRELGSELQKSEEGGYFARVVGELKTAGILEYPAAGSVRAAETLFPEGLS
jgi:hypothetical protein